MDFSFIQQSINTLPENLSGRIIFIIFNYWPSLLRGALATLLISIVSTAFGCLIGFIVGILQTLPMKKADGFSINNFLVALIKKICIIYVEVFRGTPMMVQAMFLYYGSAIIFGINMSMWFSAFFIVSINTGAYMAETVRGGILSIDDGQIEGAKAIGMNHYQTMMYVILPQALRNIMPQISNNLIINIKDTSVLSAIGIVELFFASKSIAGTYYTYFETFTVTMLIYLLMTTSFSFLLRKLEKKLAGPQNYDLATTDTLTYTSGLFRYEGKSDKYDEK